MIKILMFLSLLLVGCGPRITETNMEVIPPPENPYDKLSAEELTKVSSSELCASVKNAIYKSSVKVLNELVNNRGYKDCSSGEVFCRETVSLKPGTAEYANCRIERDKLALEAAKALNDAYYQERVLLRSYYPADVNVRHSYD